MRKLFIALMLSFFMAASCHAKALTITATIFPVYDWVREITKGTDANIKLLLDNGVDLHSYNPSVDDIVRISTCDVFIYVGGESYEWVKDALKNVTNKNQIVINLLDVMGDAVKEEEITEGMQHEHEHEHEQLEHEHEYEQHEHHEHEQREHEYEHGHEDEHHEQHEQGNEQHEHEYEQHEPKPEHEREYNEHGHEDEQQEHHHEHVQHEHEHESESDEHVWLSLRNAEIICIYISDKLSEIDPEHKEIYALNTSAYIERLSELDRKYHDVIDSSSGKILLFADRFPFRYMTDDYGLKYYAAFSGCSAESEASFETVKFLAEKTDEFNLPCVITIDGTKHKIAETVIANTKMKNQKILVLDSMQSATLNDIKNGVSYLSVMESNLEVLKAALN